MLSLSSCSEISKHFIVLYKNGINLTQQKRAIRCQVVKRVGMMEIRLQSTEEIWQEMIAGAMTAVVADIERTVTFRGRRIFLKCRSFRENQKGKILLKQGRMPVRIVVAG